MANGWLAQDVEEAFNSPSSPIQPLAPSDTPSQSFSSQSPKGINKVLLAAISIIGGLVLIGGGAFAYFNYFQPPEKVVQNETTPDATLEEQAYSNVQYGFKINAPKGWRVDESGQFGTLVIFFNTKTDLEGASPFAANINVISVSAQGLNLNDYADATKEAESEQLQNYKSTEDKTVSVNGTQARIIGGTFVQGSFHLRNLQLIAVKDEQAYIVTGTALESTWNQYQDLIELSLLTFDLN